MVLPFLLIVPIRSLEAFHQLKSITMPLAYQCETLDEEGLDVQETFNDKST
jgi:hypothetical protein